MLLIVTWYQNNALGDRNVVKWMKSFEKWLHMAKIELLWGFQLNEKLLVAKQGFVARQFSRQAKAP